jgi:hypothetical protein
MKYVQNKESARYSLFFKPLPTCNHCGKVLQTLENAEWYKIVENEEWIICHDCFREIMSPK